MLARAPAGRALSIPPVCCYLWDMTKPDADSGDQTVSRTSLLENPTYWHERAEEARTRADLFNGERSRQIMLDIAQSYDQLAERAERRVRKLRR